MWTTLRRVTRERGPLALFLKRGGTVGVMVGLASLFLLVFALQGMSVGAVILAIVAGAVALTKAHRAGQEARMATIAQQQGFKTTAEVIGKQMFRPYRGPTKARLRFRTEDGVTGTSNPWDVADLRYVNIGETISVYVWKDAAWWVEDVGARPAMPHHMPKVRRANGAG